MTNKPNDVRVSRMTGAAPQPPALGGEPEVLAKVDAQGVLLRKGVLRSVELIDRAHLAPLQAETERLKARCDELEKLLRWWRSEAGGMFSCLSYETGAALSNPAHGGSRKD
ncbi:hypothetical protein [Pseudomonas savastanoi]|uniref:hypothetical protein n=1 Tax=Pseudomonas savastanoi TaxID=29438 RepID=UPI000EFDE4FF|nr:hypothetical protein [Pseudomonas savastanoi]